MNICQNPKCNKETINPKYCCSVCAATVNNTLFPKRSKKSRTCKVCGVKLTGRRTVCDEHNPQNVDWSQITYSDLSDKLAYQKHSRMRTLARNSYLKSDKPKECAICGYDKHFHVCHIKAINSFSGDTPITTINDLENLVALCPNHHFELDTGLLTL